MSKNDNLSYDAQDVIWDTFLQFIKDLREDGRLSELEPYIPKKTRTRKTIAGT